MFNRRQFLIAGGAATLAGMVSCKTGALEPPVEKGKSRNTLRSITYNVQDCRAAQVFDNDPELIARARQQMPLRIALELGLYDPDIVALQEAPPEKVVARMADQLKMHYVFFPGGEAPNENPGAILARGKILESQNCPMVKGPCPKELFTRYWGRAVVRTDLGEIVVHAAHLWPYEGAGDREVVEILAAMQRDIRQNRSILFQGDLNRRPNSSGYQLCRQAGLIDTFDAKGAGGAMTCAGTNTHEHPTPVERIDYIWAFGPVVQYLQQCRVLFEKAFRPYPDDSGSFALSDHLPVMATFAKNPK